VNIKIHFKLNIIKNLGLVNSILVKETEKQTRETFRDKQEKVMRDGLAKKQQEILQRLKKQS